MMHNNKLSQMIARDLWAVDFDILVYTYDPEPGLLLLIKTIKSHYY